MAFTGQTDTYAAQNEKRPNAKASDANAKVRVARFKYTATDFATQVVPGRISLVKLPAGRVTILTEESKWTASDAAATAVLDIGYGAYTTPADVPVVEDPDYFVTDAAIASGPLTDDLNESAAGVMKEIVSRDGFDIVADIVTANFDGATDFLEGYVTYILGN